MIYRFVFIYFLLMGSCFADNMTKPIYYYEPLVDGVIHKDVSNVAYGCVFWSYEQNNRNNSADRARRFLPQDIVGCSLMDFGCNEGGVLLACKQLGAKGIFGIDYNGWCIEQANKKAQQAGWTDAQFIVGDMENKGLYMQLPMVDTVFLLAILDTSSFANKQAVLSDVARHAKKCLYYEGHVTHESHVRRFYELLISTDFTRFEYLGRFDGRILIRCSRGLYTLNDIPRGAITSDHPPDVQFQAREIYVFTDSPRNPSFSANCHLIQYVERK